MRSLHSNVRKFNKRKFATTSSSWAARVKAVVPGHRMERGGMKCQ